MKCEHYNITRWESSVHCDDCNASFSDGTLEYFILVKRFTYAMSIRNYLIMNKVSKSLKNEMNDIQSKLLKTFDSDEEALSIKSKAEWFFRRNKGIDPNGSRMAVNS